MNKSYYIPQIQEYCKEVEPGQTERFVCPLCEGGSSGERSLSITRRSSTEAFYNCFRAKCSLGGGHIAVFSGLDGEILKAKSKKPTVNDITRNLTGLDEETVEFFTDKYHMTPGMLAYGRFQTTVDRRIHMPMFDPNRIVRGASVRKYKPLYVGRREYASIPKALIKFTPKSDEIGLSWYYKNRHRKRNSRDLVVVEDIVSALRATQFVDSVSLMGTVLNDEKQREIRRMGYRNVYVALDEDATLKAIHLKKKCKLYIPNVRVLTLKKDIKDMTPEELKERFDECNIM